MECFVSRTAALTDISIRNLKANPGERLEAWDEKVPGLGIRVSSTGTKSFVLLYRIGGQAKRMTLGRYPVVSLADARKLATEALYKISHDQNPQQDKEDARSFPRCDETVDQFVRLHCSRHNRDSTARQTERIMRNRFLPTWAAKDVRKITKRDVIKVLDAIVEEGLPSAANQAFAAVRKFSNWCVQRGIIDASPCTGIGTPSPLGKRDRVLADDELALIWTAAKTIGYPYGCIVQLLILTGQRRNEVAGLCWSEIDTGAGLWSFPPDRMKSGRPHQVPLLPMASAVIDGLPRLNTTFAFPARGSDDSSFSGFSKLKKRVDEVSVVTGWTLHDLRRTVATGMAGLGVAPHVVEKLLNHSTGSLGGVAGIYNRFQYVPEMRDALAKWEAHLQAITATKVPAQSET
jgi:integrase